MKTWGSGGIDPRILDLGTSWSGQLYPPVYVGEETGWAPKTHLDALEGRQTFPLPGLELRPSPVQPVASRYTDCTVPTVRWEGNIEISLKEVG